MVKAETVHKRFGHLKILKGFSIEVQRGEVVWLLVVSGLGKSTFLRCINHLEKLDAGRLWVDGHMVGYKQIGDCIYELRDHQVCVRFVIMDDGKIIEDGAPAAFFNHPREERTQQFLSKIL